MKAKPFSRVVDPGKLRPTFWWLLNGHLTKIGIPYLINKWQQYLIRKHVYKHFNGLYNKVLCPIASVVTCMFLFLSLLHFYIIYMFFVIHFILHSLALNSNLGFCLITITEIPWHFSQIKLVTLRFNGIWQH